MIKPIWQIFRPLEKIVRPNMCISMVSDYDRIRFVYADSKNGEIVRKVYIDFTEGIESLRRSRTVNRCDDFVDIDATKNWGFVSEDSDYLDWTIERSIYNKQQLNCKHYLFVTEEEIIEVLSTFQPVVVVENFGDNK